MPLPSIVLPAQIWNGSTGIQEAVTQPLIPCVAALHRHLGSSPPVVCEVFAEHMYKTSADSVNKVQYNQIGSI